MEHKLNFYDKNGYPFTFEKVEGDGITFNRTSVLIDPISVSLFDCQNIFLLENIDGSYYFPQLEYGETLEIKWADIDDESSFFTFDVLHDTENNQPYIQRINKPYIVDYSSVPSRYGSRYAGKIPYQVNVAFSPKEEIKYERSLNIYLKKNGIYVDCWQFYFYGEGIEEDDRFRIHLENFGIKFNRTDALCLKDYDVTEAMPDWESVNAARKALFVNKEEIFPYVGTYYGLKNLLTVMGYSNELDVKEYWEDISEDSTYKGKYVITSISDMLDDGIIQESSLLDNSGAMIKDSKYFRKTGFLALCYEFTRPSGKYDNNECPIVERTTQFKSSEIFFKLQGLKKILQSNFLPVNVHIKDLIGEYVYYISFSKLVWVDKLNIEIVNVNEDIKINVFPSADKTYIRNLYSFFKVENENTFKFPNRSLPMDYLDEHFDDAESREIFKNLIPSCIPNIDKNCLNDTLIEYYNEVITNFYKFEVSNHRHIYNDLNDSNEDFGDMMHESITSSGQKKFWQHMTIGCPVVLSADIEDFKFSSFINTKLEDYFFDGEFKDPHFNATLDSVKFKDYYEIEWRVKYVGYPEDLGGGYRTEKFDFSYRTSIRKGVNLPVFLPYEGYYDVCLLLYSLSGNVTKRYDNRRIEVKTFRPEIVACYTGDDKFSFTAKDLSNVRVCDFNNTTANNPCVNVLFMDDENNDNVNIPRDLYDSSVISWFENDTEVYDPYTNKWDSFDESEFKYKSRLKFGDGDCIRIMDYENARINDLFHLKPVDTVLSRDCIPGFKINAKHVVPGLQLLIGYTGSGEGKVGYNKICIKDFSDFDDLCHKLNNPGEQYDVDDCKLLSNYEFYYSTCVSEDGDTYLYAVGKQGSIDGFQYITVLSPDNEIIDINEDCDEYHKYPFTFDAPRYGFYKDHPGDKTVNPLLSLNIDYNDIMSGAAYDPQYMIDKGFFCYREQGRPYHSDYIVELQDRMEMYEEYWLEEKRENDRHESWKGTLPVIFNNNYINLSTTKFAKGSFIIPRFKYVIFFVDNLHRQVEYKWTLTDENGKIIVATRKNPYFIWRFEDAGTYNISYWCKDAVGNDYLNDRFGMVTVLDGNEYREFIEHKLNERKAKNK